MKQKQSNMNQLNDDVTVIDSEWITKTFMVPTSQLEEVDQTNRYYSTANNKFTDSSLGGNIGINPRPQFNRYADIRIPGRRMDRGKVSTSRTDPNNGMGRYYSELIDDNDQVVYLELGGPRFNNLFDFMSKAVNYKDSVLANTGRSPIGYELGQIIGGTAMLVAFPLVTVSIWTIKKAAGLFVGNNNFNYYYLEPQMHKYWTTVGNIVNQLATELGILIPSFMEDGTKADKIGAVVEMDQSDLNVMKELLPGLITENNYIDIFAIATKAQGLANRQALIDNQRYRNKKENEFDFTGYVKDRYTIEEKNSAGKGMSAYINKVLSLGSLFNPEEESEKSTGVPDTNAKVTTENGKVKYDKSTDGTYPKASEKDLSYTKRFIDAFDSSVRDGATHVAFRVDYVGSSTESFSNSIGEIEVGEKFKSMASKSKDMKFNLSGGNLLGDTVKDAVGYARDVAMGVLDSVTYGAGNVLQTLMGGGFIDIPKKWDDSSVSLPTHTFTMSLVSDSNNTLSNLQNIYIPFAAILATALPQMTGKASYTSPFLCGMFLKGIQKIKMGMVTELSVTRATGNLGYDKNGLALGMEISFTVTDFSNIMSAPVNSSMFDVLNIELDDDSLLSSYLSTIAARDLYTNKYAVPKAKLAASRAMMKWQQAVSPSSFGMRTGNVLNPVLGAFVSGDSLSMR
jgi:hypothetical protein